LNARNARERLTGATAFVVAVEKIEADSLRGVVLVEKLPDGF